MKSSSQWWEDSSVCSVWDTVKVTLQNMRVHAATSSLSSLTLRPQHDRPWKMNSSQDASSSPDTMRMKHKSFHLKIREIQLLHQVKCKRLRNSPSAVTKFLLPLSVLSEMLVSVPIC